LNKFSDTHVLDFLSIFIRPGRIRVVARILFGVVLFCLVCLGGAKWLHRTPAKTAFLQTREKESVGANSGRLLNSNLAEQSALRAESGMDLLNGRNSELLRSSMKLRRIIRFGRSLELIGSVEAGSRLTLNDDPVEVNGDGSFKHFTTPFPRTIKKIKLVLKATNLAGETAELIEPYNFGDRNRDY
jgi:hypothetical protein